MELEKIAKKIFASVLFGTLALTTLQNAPIYSMHEMHQHTEDNCNYRPLEFPRIDYTTGRADEYIIQK